MAESDHADPGRASGERNAFLAALNALDRGLGWLERTIVAGSVLVMALIMSGHVVGNLLFDRGIPGTYEMTEMLIEEETLDYKQLQDLVKKYYPDGLGDEKIPMPASAALM